MDEYHQGTIKHLCNGSIDSFNDPIYIFSSYLQSGFLHPYHIKQSEVFKLNEWDRYYFKLFKRQVIQDNFLRAIQYLISHICINITQIFKKNKKFI